MTPGSDLTAAEQSHVRAAMRFLKVKFGTWDLLAKLLHFKPSTLSDINNGDPVTASLAFRIARTAKVGIDDLLAGKYPPKGACPHCGRPVTDEGG